MEDDTQYSFELCTVLEADEHAVIWCRDADEAIDWLRNNTCDLVLTDIIIATPTAGPQPGGIRLVNALRAVRETTDVLSHPHVPIIAISGAGADATDRTMRILNSAKRVGADQVVAKQEGTLAVRNAVNAALRQSAHQNTS
jgi:DNA-binding response OmpR family regulator